MRETLLDHYGFVENASNLSTLRDYLELIPETGIKHAHFVQQIIHFKVHQKAKQHKGNTWDERSAVRALHALGFISIDRSNNIYHLTDLGTKLLQTPKASDKVGRFRKLIDREQDIFLKGILTNPPAVSTLRLLYNAFREKGEGLSKYELGSVLGFVGEPGFTHLDSEWIVANGFSFNNKERNME